MTPFSDDGAVRLFAVLTGGILLLQGAHYSHQTLQAAVPSLSNDDLLTMRFHHACMPMAPASPSLPPAVTSAWQCAAGAMLCLAAVMKASRCLQCAAAAAFASVAYMLLLESSLYQNHLWLLVNLLLCMAVVPTKPPSCGARVLLHLLRFATSLPYIFGALSKLTSEDWMAHHQPARRWCGRELAWSRVISSMRPHICAALLSHGGVAVDALVVPLLAASVWRRHDHGTRWLPQAMRLVGTCLALAFHGANASLFHIGIFPWLMVAGLSLWWSGDAEAVVPEAARTGPRHEAQSPPSWWIRGFRNGFMLLHLSLPLRRFVAPGAGDPTWSQEGYLGSWLMKRHQTDGLAALHISRRCTDSIGASASSVILVLPQLDPTLTLHQRRFVSVRPDALRQYARHRAALLASGNCSVDAAHAVSCFTHNGRSPQPLYRSTANLLRVQPSCAPMATSSLGDWLVPLWPRSFPGRSTEPSSPGPPECDPSLLWRPAELLRQADNGLRVLHAAVHEAGSEPESRQPQDQASMFDEDGIGWFWHELRVLHEAIEDTQVQAASRATGPRTGHQKAS